MGLGLLSAALKQQQLYDSVKRYRTVIIVFLVDLGVTRRFLIHLMKLSEIKFAGVYSNVVVDNIKPKLL